MQRDVPRLVGFLACVLAGWFGTIYAQKELSCGEVEGRKADCPVFLTTDEPAEGVSFALAFDPAFLLCTDVRPAPITTAAELFEAAIHPSGVTVRCVMDLPPPSGVPLIPAGPRQPVAILTLKARAILPEGFERTVPLRFAESLGTPPVANSITARGRQVTPSEGLGLRAGSFHILPRGDRLRVQSPEGAPGQFTLSVPIVADTVNPLQGYVLCLSHPPDLSLKEITTAGTAASAIDIEYEASSEGPTWGSLSVLFAGDLPHDGQTLPPGEDLTVAFFRYQVAPFTADDPWEPACRTYPLTLSEEVSEETGCANFFLEEDTRVYPELIDGSVTFCAPGNKMPSFFVGASTGGRDPEITCAEAALTEDLAVSFFYTSPVPLQGVSLALRYPPELHILDLNGSNRGIVTERHLADTLTAAVRAEYVSFNANDDTGELIVGIVVDSTPPIPLTHMLPPRDQIGKLLNVFFRIDPQAPCSACVDLTFEDGLLGAGVVPIFNRASVFNESRPALVHNGCACFDPKVHFYVGADTGGEATEVIEATGNAGGEAAVTLYYSSRIFPLQGLSMAVSFPPELELADLDPTGQGLVGRRHLAGTLTDGLNVEYLSFNADNERGELIVGVLVDSTPPVPLNHMFPALQHPAAVVRLFFEIPPAASCGTVYPLRFRNALTGAGNVPVFNRVAIFNRSCPAVTHDGALRVVGRAPFLRGDCNSDWQVDIADPAATMSYLFLRTYDPACLDACDSNDDGLVDLTDVANTLRFLVELGPAPPSPGPYPPGGFDPTPDLYGVDLGCRRGQACEEGS